MPTHDQKNVGSAPRTKNLSGPQCGPYINSPIPLGRYRHYKGRDYEVIGVARHSETLEELVVYRALYGDHGLWVRPRAMFLETIEFQGQQIPRFQFIDTNQRDTHER